ncbi:hypothetical protein Cadr_000017459 [Camelus dromedarius]|uniref:Uncharacterized protein n=1 Tax=Camelus dromedarius TaxID=9838 RepID=A0A5N4DEJ8_CAMDR|nr:hypothetical protein Cadr_000017459 [Camelus dromedarius]
MSSSPHPGSARDSQGHGGSLFWPSRRPAKGLVSLWEDRGSRPSKASLQAAAMGQKPLVHMKGSGRPQAEGEKGRCPQGHKEGCRGQGGTLAQPVLFTEGERGVGGLGPSIHQPVLREQGNRVVDVPTTSPHKNPKRQVILTCLFYEGRVPALKEQMSEMSIKPISVPRVHYRVKALRSGPADGQELAWQPGEEGGFPRQRSSVIVPA